MPKLWWYFVLSISWLVLLMSGCSTETPAGQNAAATLPRTPEQARRTPTSPLLSTPTSVPVPTSTESKPSPPTGYVEPTSVPTPTLITSPVAVEWEEIILPSPKGSEQLVPDQVVLPTVHLSIPTQWAYVERPGMWFVGPEPESAPPVLQIAPNLPFADWGEPTPQNREEFVDALVRVYQRAYGVTEVHTEYISVGGRESVELFPLEGEVCMDLFVPVGERYDIVYKLTFAHSLCVADRDELTETGKFILQSMKFSP